MTISLNSTVIGSIFVLILAGCASKERYEKPISGAPDTWNSTVDQKLVKLEQETHTSPTIPWWEGVGSGALNNLMKKALQNNYELQIAKARIDEAQAMYGVTSSKLLPKIDFTSEISREGGQESSGADSALDTLSQSGVKVDLDVDIAGGSRSQAAAQNAVVKRIAVEYKQTMLSLLAEVARNYVDHCRAAQLLALNKKILLCSATPCAL